MLYFIYFVLSSYMDFGNAGTGITCGSLPGTTTEVQRVGFPSAEIRFVSPPLGLFRAPRPGATHQIHSPSAAEEQRREGHHLREERVELVV
jgi:hypothetical protein